MHTHYVDCKMENDFSPTQGELHTVILFCFTVNPGNISREIILEITLEKLEVFEGC